MTDDEFFAEIDRLGVQRTHVSLTGGIPPDKFCLEERESDWCVYYSERGDRVDEARHPSRNAALADLLARIQAAARYLTQPPSKGGAPSIHDLRGGMHPPPRGD